MAKRTDRQEIVQIPNPPLFYNTLRIRFINCLVWGIYRDLTNQDGKRLSLCLVIMFFICSAQKIDAASRISERNKKYHFGD